MLLFAFRSLGFQFVVIATIGALAALVALLVGGKQAALDVLTVGVTGMKGPWVWTFGYGLASFVRGRGPLLPLDLNGIFEPSAPIAHATARLERSTRHRRALPYTFPITALGALLTFFYELPTSGFPYAFLFVMVCSIYYVGAFLLFNFVEITLAFHDLLEYEIEVRFRRFYSPIHLENITSYLALTTAIGLVGIYAGFRGTLTAGFQFDNQTWRTFLSVPIVLFLPGTLLYNYYPRYVLRKILQHKVFRTMERLGRADDSSARDLVLDLKEAMALNAEILPFLDHKSLPAYLLAISFGISVAYNSDPAIRQFVGYLLNVGR